MFLENGGQHLFGIDFSTLYFVVSALCDVDFVLNSILHFVFLGKSFLTTACGSIWGFCLHFAFVEPWFVTPQVKNSGYYCGRSLVSILIGYCCTGFAAFITQWFYAPLNFVIDFGVRPVLLGALSLIAGIWALADRIEDGCCEFVDRLAPYAFTQAAFLVQYCTQSVVFTVQGWYHCCVEVYHDYYGDGLVVETGLFFVVEIIVIACRESTYDSDSPPPPYEELSGANSQNEDVEIYSDGQSVASFYNDRFDVDSATGSPFNKLDNEICNAQSMVVRNDDKGFEESTSDEKYFDCIEYKEFDNDSDSQSEWETVYTDSDDESSIDHLNRIGYEDLEDDSDNESDWVTEYCDSDDESSADHSFCEFCFLEYRTKTCRFN